MSTVQQLTAQQQAILNERNRLAAQGKSTADHDMVLKMYGIEIEKAQNPQPAKAPTPPPIPQQSRELQLLLQRAKSPANLPAPGTYGEGRVVEIQKTLNDLKSAVQKGELSIGDYNTVAEPLVKYAADYTGGIAGRGSKAANAVNPLWAQIQSGGFVVAENGKWEANLPFTRQEYAKLPESVLPKREDVDKGLIDPTKAPFERYQPSAPQVNPGPGGTDPNSSIPTNINLGTDRGKVELESQRQAQELQNTLNQQQDIYKNALAKYTQDVEGIPKAFQDEGIYQQQQLEALAEKQKGLRAQMLAELADSLAKQQRDQFGAMVPQLAEHANTQGIFRSTGFGDILSREALKLEAARQNALAQQGISDYGLYINDIGSAVNRALDYRGLGTSARATNLKNIADTGFKISGDYASGLGTITNNRLGLQNQGLQRQFSLDDFARQVEAGKQLGSLTTPQVSSSSGKGAGALTGGLGGAATGANFGPWGAGIGGAIGAIGGGQLGGR